MVMVARLCDTVESLIQNLDNGLKKSEVIQAAQWLTKAQTIAEAGSGRSVDLSRSPAIAEKSPSLQNSMEAVLTGPEVQVQVFWLAEPEPRVRTWCT